MENLSDPFANFNHILDQHRKEIEELIEDSKIEKFVNSILLDKSFDEFIEQANKLTEPFQTYLESKSYNDFSEFLYSQSDVASSSLTPDIVSQINQASAGIRSLVINSRPAIESFNNSIREIVNSTDFHATQSAIRDFALLQSKIIKYMAPTIESFSKAIELQHHALEYPRNSKDYRQDTLPSFSEFEDYFSESLATLNTSITKENRSEKKQAGSFKHENIINLLEADNSGVIEFDIFRNNIRFFFILIIRLLNSKYNRHKVGIKRTVQLLELLAMVMAFHGYYDDIVRTKKEPATLDDIKRIESQENNLIKQQDTILNFLRNLESYSKEIKSRKMKIKCFIHSKYTEKSKIIDTIVAGSLVQVVHIKHKWCMISYIKGNDSLYLCGWVKKKYLKKIKE